MATFHVEGGKQLNGEIVPQGAKNEALQILCAVLLTDEPVTVKNIPNIRDVNNLIELLKGLSVKTTQISDTEYTFQANNVNLDYLHSDTFKQKSQTIRGSIMIAGPLLARFGEVFIPRPGGDKIGRRRLDTHFIGLNKLGANFRFYSKAVGYTAKTNKLIGKYMLLEEASVTGTANILMAAVLAEGKTTIYNAACEPYIQQLSKMLASMGAKISGISNNK